MSKYYEYIRWANEADHHPSVESSFTINDTINKNTSFEIKFANRNTWANPYTNSSSTGFWMNIRSNGVNEANYFSQKASTNRVDSGTIKYDKNKYYVDGTLVNTLSVVSTMATGITINQSVYGDNENSLDIYYIKVWQNGVLTRHLIPCLNNSNQKGMYDIVSNTFFKDNKSTSTLHNERYLVSVSSSGNGTASGGGIFSSGSSATVKATPNDGFVFLNWTENGTVVSTNSTYTFSVSKSTELTANFKKKSNCKFKNNGAWVDATMYIKKNGSWKEGELKVRQGSWKGAI